MRDANTAEQLTAVTALHSGYPPRPSPRLRSWILDAGKVQALKQKAYSFASHVPITASDSSRQGLNSGIRLRKITSSDNIDSVNRLGSVDGQQSRGTTFKVTNVLAGDRLKVSLLKF